MMAVTAQAQSRRNIKRNDIVVPTLEGIHESAANYTNVTTYHVDSFQAAQSSTARNLWYSIAADATLPALTGITLAVSSSSGSDTTPKAVTIEYIDTSFDIATAVATVLVGQSETTTTITDAIRVIDAYQSAGTAFAGSVYIYDASEASITAGVPQTAGKILGRITLLDGSLRNSFSYVPRNYEGFIERWSGYTSIGEVDDGAIFRLQYRPTGTVYWILLDDTYLGVNDVFERVYAKPLFVPEKADIRVVTDATSATLIVGSSYDLMIYNEP